MDDRELLELAAKAGGYEMARWSDDDCYLLLGGFQDPWNPLADDGDALRLAVRLEIEICHFFHYDMSDMACGATIETPLDYLASSRRFVEKYNGDPCAATRRAIVRAASSVVPAAYPEPNKA